MQRGKFITFEGPDGSGKTTNAAVLAMHLRERGYKVIVTREPGGCPLSENIRELLLGNKMDPVTEMLLMAASRREHLKHKIVPALYAGHVVISDRFYDSSIAYQGFGRGLFNETTAVNEIVLEGFQPDYTLFFDIPLEESSRRLAERNRRKGDNNRIDEESDEFKKAVHTGYDHQFRKNQHRMFRINALPDSDDVAQQVIRWANSIFEYKAQ